SPVVPSSPVPVYIRLSFTKVERPLTAHHEEQRHNDNSECLILDTGEHHLVLHKLHLAGPCAFLTLKVQLGAFHKGDDATHKADDHKDHQDGDDDDQKGAHGFYLIVGEGNARGESSTS